MKKSIWIILLHVLYMNLIISCVEKADLDQKEEYSTSEYFKNMPLEILNLSALKISATDTIITSEMACNVAKLANIYNCIQTKSTVVKEVDDVIIINDSNNNPLFYAINYKNGLGYILVSATKNYYPILAYVDRGHFDETVYASGVSVLIDNYKKNINYWNTKQPVDSTERMKKLWRKYEKLSFDFNKSTRSESDLRGDQVLEWSVAGKLVHNMVDVAMLLPADVYQTFCNTAMIECNPEYDYLENSVVVEYTISPDFSYLIQSKWNQYAPYNYSCPMKNGKPTLVGCSAVAVGQIMKYHQWPRNISWNLMPNSLTASGISELSDFLYEVGEAMNTSYGNIASSVTESSIVLALVEYGYNNDYANFYNESDVRASLLNNRPVLMLGQKDLNNDEQTEGGHAWICDGHIYTEFQRCFELYITSYDNPLRLIPTSCTYTIYEPNPYHLYHMNWGYGGINDGWYRYAQYPHDSLNFSFQLRHITNIRPDYEN